MQINKKFLLATFIISAHGAIISMEQETELMRACKLVNKAINNANFEAKQQAELIVHFSKDSSTDAVRNRQYMESVGTWLTQQRKNFPDEQWKDLVKTLNSSVSSHPVIDLYPATHNRDAVIKIIEEIVISLKPGEDCSQLLADRIEAKLKTITK